MALLAEPGTHYFFLRRIIHLEYKILMDQNSRTPKACQACRKAKQRCDAMVNFPSKCSRCERLHKYCQFVDSNHAPVGALSPVSRGDNASSDRKKWQLPDYSQYTYHMPFTMDDNNIKTKFGDLVIDVPTQLAMYKEYIMHFHPLFPVIPDSLLEPGSALFRSSRKLLYWTMLLAVTTTSRHQWGLYRTELLPHVQLLISQGYDRDYLRNPYDTISYILALSLMGFWHTGARRMQDDSAWIYNGMAYQLALIMGLHTDQGREYGAIVSKGAKQSVWVALYVTNSLMAMGYGLPATHTDLPIVLKSDTDLDIQARLLRIYNRFINEATDAASCTPILLRIFNNNITSTLDEVEIEPSPLTHLMSLYTRTIFYVNYLVHTKDHETVISYIYSCAAQTTATINRYDDKTAVVLPGFVVRLEVIIVVVLYRLLAAKCIRDTNDIVSAMDLIGKLYKQCQNQEKSFYWAVQFIQSLQPFYHSGAMPEEICSMKTRGGAGIVIDTAMRVMAWRKTHDPSYAHDFEAESHRLADGHERVTLMDIDQ